MNHHLTYKDRLKLEALIKAKISKKECAKIIGCSLSTIYREISRGKYFRLDTHLIETSSYSAEIGQHLHRYYGSAKGQKLKIGNDYKTASFIENMVKKKYSPAVVSYMLRISDLTSLSFKTIYNYIHSDVLNINRKDLTYARKQKRSFFRKDSQVDRLSIKRIDERDQDIIYRSDFGHWELDTVVSSQSHHCLLVLTERKSRFELIYKIVSRSQAAVKRVFDRLERQLKDFSNIFKTVTCDNGVEFLNPSLIENSCLLKQKRTNLYYCHPYSSFERGSNENQNRFIRRFFPKGSSFKKITSDVVQNIQDFINFYPRNMFDFRCSAEIFPYTDFFCK